MNLVFFTTCSKTKAGNGQSYKDFEYDNKRSKDLLHLRNTLHDILLKKEALSLHNPTKGPDFISDSNIPGEYLESRNRYFRGQFMTSLNHELGDSTKSWFETNKLIFISGLYGILESSEPIQDYDVELKEYVESYWKEKKDTLTNILIDSLESDSILFDCCGDSRYSNMLNWDTLEDKGFTVWHAIDFDRDGGQVRAESGVIAARIDTYLQKINSNGVSFPGSNAKIKFVSNEEFYNMLISIEIQRLISKGEGDQIEFKSTLLWDIKENKIDIKRMTGIVLKSISAFSNGQGGKLLIGIKDDMEILGLEHDYNFPKVSNKDTFELYLNNLLNNNFGKEFTITHIEINFPKINETEICEVNILRGTKPLYLVTEDKNGQKCKKFYVRSGNSSQELEIDEVASYVNKRF